jgi:hypothetical protein
MKFKRLLCSQISLKNSNGNMKFCLKNDLMKVHLGPRVGFGGLMTNN